MDIDAEASGARQGKPRGWAGERPTDVTAELKRAADQLAAVVERGETPDSEQIRRLELLGALDLIRSSRPTARAKGLELLERLTDSASEQANEKALRDFGLAP